MDKLETACNEIKPPNNLDFCTRCGQSVEAYQANNCGLVDDYADDYSPPLQPENVAREKHSGYFCKHCNARWVAISCQDTGMIVQCGHFMPLYAQYCSICGHRV